MSSPKASGFALPSSAGLSAAPSSEFLSSLSGVEGAAESLLACRELDLFSHAHFQRAAQQLDLFGSYVIPELITPWSKSGC